MTEKYGKRCEFCGEFVPSWRKHFCPMEKELNKLKIRKFILKSKLFTVREIEEQFKTNNINVTKGYIRDVVRELEKERKIKNIGASVWRVL